MRSMLAQFAVVVGVVVVVVGCEMADRRQRSVTAGGGGGGVVGVELALTVWRPGGGDLRPARKWSTTTRCCCCYGSNYHWVLELVRRWSSCYCCWRGTASESTTMSATRTT